MSSSISKRFSLPSMTSEKHPIKLRRRSGAPKKNHGDVVRNTLDKSLNLSFSEKKKKTSPKLISRSIEKLTGSSKSIKSIKKLTSKISEKIFPTKQYDVQKEEEKFQESPNASVFDYNLSASSPCSSKDLLSFDKDLSGVSFSSKDSFLDDESTLSTLSCDTSLFEDENWLETENKECNKTIRQSVKETTTYIQKIISDSIKSIREDAGTRYNKILQQKQNENIQALEEIHNKCLNSLDEMETRIKKAMNQREESAMVVIGNFRTKLEDSRVFFKRIEKTQGKMLKAAEDKVEQQREEILVLKKNTVNQERDDVLDY